MLANRILLTTPCYPYPTLPANDSLTDATGQRFTHGDHIFSIFSHTHCYANHILAQNIDVPSVVLEYPRWRDFTDEVDRGYPVVGISAFPPHLDRVMEMCTYVRRRSPASKILLGSYGGQAFRASYDHETQKRYVDHVVQGEGVRFLRRLLGEGTDRPVRQALMPKAGGCPPYVSRFPQGSIGFLVSGLGCVGGCDFCSSTALFDRKRLELLTPQELVDHMALFHEHFPAVSQVFVIEEDHFRQPGYLAAVRDYWLAHPDVVESMDWFAFGSIDHIGKFAEKYGWDAIPETGIGCIFIGVESKFAGDHGYDKRDEIDAREVFSRLHAMGIRTIGAWMCGWDFHHHGNVHEDLNYFVALQPTYQQLTRVSPFPGTPLWERLREEGRCMDVPWDDVHFWSGAQKNIHLETHETLNLVEEGYDLMYRTWGPSVLRRLDVQLAGLSYCRRSPRAIFRREKARFHKRQCALMWANLYAMDRFAPNGVVRRRVRTADATYRRVIGEPTPVMKALGRGLEAMATLFKIKEPLDPLNRHPKEEPFKRYRYDKNGRSEQATPYTTTMNPMPWATRLAMAQGRYNTAALAKAMKVVRWSRSYDSDPEIDDFLVELVSGGRLGFGF